MFTTLLIVAALLGILWIVGKLTGNGLGGDIVIAIAIVIAAVDLFVHYVPHWW